MNKFSLSAIAAALVLSGCSSMMYGDSVAPIVSLNTSVGQQQMLQPQNTPAEPTGGYRGQVANTTQQANTASAQSFTQPVNAQNTPLVPQQNISPYQPVQNNQTANNDDGWSVTPGKNGLEQNTQTAQAEAEKPQENRPQAVRPQMANESTGPKPSEPKPETAENKPQEPSSNQTPAENKPQGSNEQVASVTQPSEPQQPPAEEDAVSTLLKKASASLGKGDYDGAAAYLENAQRIEPQNAKILYDIANIRYHQKRYREAESFASRAVQVGGGNSTMKKTWALIANARKSLGDNQGAITAAEKAASL
ncbi:tetratricopeptide repeat protein [Suttonella sp. R2A3]|uniref:tetratricopeptide repeat protein n=1 Tax=Suttonella sp. R2A3 TaxID=2908648 RepID=UPI001F394F8D|nr:tetratricopeptide repeat protein [Suttonella sp. R2A3]UJF24996.1 tetratricopeptide repeat protein [Suttonella sp. R2A3]